MTSLYSEVLLWTLAISSGVMAGTYFAFSGFIMKSLDSLSGDAAAAAMNAINTIILKSSFMPLFFGSTAVAVALTVNGILYLDEVGAAWALTAGLCYAIGMFVVTAVFNVPLNNTLANAPAAEVGLLWQTYLGRWTRWNSLRAMASLASCVICIGLLAA